jgi:hypothetical protein
VMFGDGIIVSLTSNSSLGKGRYAVLRGRHR